MRMSGSLSAPRLSLSSLDAWLDNPLAKPHALEIGIAVALAGAVMLLSWALLRWSGPALAATWARYIGTHAEGFGQRVVRICRYGFSALMLAMLLAAWPWHATAALVIGLALGLAMAQLAHVVLRALHLPRWVALLAALILFAAMAAYSVGGLEPVTAMLERIGVDVGKRRLSLLSVLTIAITCIALFAAVRLVNRFVSHSIGTSGSLDPTQKLLAQKLSAIAVIVVAFFLGIGLVGIDLTAFAVFSGAFGLAVGFGLQKTFGNLIAGIILLMDRSIKPGDVIVVGESFGMVNKIGVRAVSVITRDGKEHLIPNENLMTQEVENWSYSDRNVRIRIPVVLGFDTDVALAHRLMMEAAAQSPRVLRSPRPTVWLTEFRESGVLHEIRVWVSDPESGLGPVKSDVLTRLLALLKENGLAVPFPQREIHVNRSDITEMPYK
jgi:small-conductance mechanosensitive channel